MTPKRDTSPIAIGGLGGSSTRAVARCLVEAGVDMGFDLNAAIDDQTFTFLFKRGGWARRSRRQGGSDLTRAVDIYAALRTGQPVGWRSGPFVVHAAFDGIASGSERETWPRRTRWAAERCLAMRCSPATPPERWGWKEPNTTMFLDVISEAFADLRYVHVLRHGLDMAHSSNRNQLRIWGDLFGLDPTSRDPRTALDMWIRFNRSAVTRGTQLLGSRFLLLNVDALSADPVAGVRELVEFLELDVDADVVERMHAIPQRPATTGRYRPHGVGGFSTEQLEAVESLGFEIAP